MSLFIASLNSGSNGNCYYVGNDTDAVLIDAGISCRETERRMKKLNLVMQKVKAIFVSHEHSDHITGVTGLSKKYKLPVYITNSTLTASRLPIEKNLVQSFSANQSITIGSLSVVAFPKFHDASDPHSFIISGNNINVGVFTDIGNVCKNVIKNFKDCNAVFLESNYCEEMLANGRYPEFLKKRISGDDGHLSNAQALELFLKYRNKQLTHLILSHLSKNNNRVELVREIFEEYAGATKIVVASRYKETEVFQINEAFSSQAKRVKKSAETQLSLF
ncbi:MAG TPA: MBL fold metallo-hydrolase [Puia sp.]|nr:MBL fold metallo-hydrolase [Puia sp.]